jgi:hypothetical protein
MSRKNRRGEVEAAGGFSDRRVPAGKFLRVPVKNFELFNYK